MSPESNYRAVLRYARVINLLADFAVSIRHFLLLFTEHFLTGWVLLRRVITGTNTLTCRVPAAPTCWAASY